MAHKIGWHELINPIDAIDNEIKKMTGVSLREKIVTRRKRNPMRNEQLFVATPDGYLPVKAFKRMH